MNEIEIIIMANTSIMSANVYRIFRIFPKNTPKNHAKNTRIPQGIIKIPIVKINRFWIYQICQPFNLYKNHFDDENSLSVTFTLYPPFSFLLWFKRYILKMMKTVYKRCAILSNIMSFPFPYFKSGFYLNICIYVS